MAELTPASLDDHEQQRVAEFLADGPAELRLTSLLKDERGLTAVAGRRHHLRIDRADPRILISAELLDTIVTTPIGMAGDTIRLSGQRNAWLVPACARPDHDYTGAVLHIDGINQHVVYRITGYVPRVRGYIGEWPD